MKFSRRWYSIITNSCLILGVGAAFGFDRTNDVAWLVLGGFAAISAIATYFLRHWQRERRNERSQPVSLQADSIESPWPTATTPHLATLEQYASTLTQRRVSHRKTGEWAPPRYDVADYYGLDPVEQVSRIIRELQTTGKRQTYTVGIAPDGHVTLSLTDASEQPQVKPRMDFSKLTPWQEPETIQ